MVRVANERALYNELTNHVSVLSVSLQNVFSKQICKVHSYHVGRSGPYILYVFVSNNILPIKHYLEKALKIEFKVNLLFSYGEVNQFSSSIELQKTSHERVPLTQENFDTPKLMLTELLMRTGWSSLVSVLIQVTFLFRRTNFLRSNFRDFTSDLMY